MAEAQNLNMVGGHFIWVWADTSSTTEFFDAYGAVPAAAPLKPDARRGADRNRGGSGGFVDREIPTLLELAKTATAGQLPSTATRQHVEGLLDRKLEFEDRHPRRGGANQQQRQQQQQQRARPATGSNEHRPQQPPERYIIGLNSEAEDLSEESAPLLKRNREPVQPLRVKSGGQKRQNKKRSSSEESAEHLFISNLNSDDDAIDFAGDRAGTGDEQMLALGTDGHGGGIDGIDVDDDNNDEANGDDNADEENGNANGGATVERKPKRKTSSFGQRYDGKEQAPIERRRLNESTTGGTVMDQQQQHVLFHHFKDFPVGFLALRPIRMHVDRHFIRAAVRLFASTWAKVELEAREHTVLSMQRAKSKLNRWGNQLRWRPPQRKRRFAAAVAPTEAPPAAVRQTVNRKTTNGRATSTLTRDNSTVSRQYEQNQNTTSGLQRDAKQQQTEAKTISSKNPKSNINAEYNGGNHGGAVRVDDDENDNDNDGDVNVGAVNEVDDDEVADGDDVVRALSGREASLSTRGNGGAIDSGAASATAASPSAEDYAGVEGGHAKSAQLNKRHNTWWSLETGVGGGAGGGAGGGGDGVGIVGGRGGGGDGASGWPRPDTDIRYMRSAPHYRGGCYGQTEEDDQLNADYFARYVGVCCALDFRGLCLHI